MQTAKLGLPLPIGCQSSFLRQPQRPGGFVVATDGARVALLLMPSLVEEVTFRALLLPHPLEGVAAPLMGAWIALSVGLFVLCHPLASSLWCPQGR